MRRALLLPGFLLLVFSNLYAGDTIPANNTLIEYTGRIDFTDSLAPEFSYSGVSIRACFNGTGIAAIMNDDQGENYYNIIIDSDVHDIINITTGEKIYNLAKDLKNTIHEIELFKRTELTFGKTKFLGFIVDDGATLVPISNKREHIIEYIGNSITCGYGNEGQLGGTFGPTTENHYLTYAAITSRNFNARHMVVSRSGIGIYRNYNGPAEGNTDCMTNYYGRIFLYDEHPVFDFAVRPDLVCINLGTNDFSTSGGDSALYVSNYFRFIDTIQTKYNMPDIVCLLGPILSGITLSVVRAYLQFIADSANSRGLGNVSFFEMSAQGALGFGIDYHPTVDQHKKNATELTEYLKSLMHWKINPRVMNAITLTEQHIQVEFNTPVYDPQDTYSGFSIGNDNINYSILQVYRDTADHSVLHIMLEGSLLPEENIFLEYVPGTLESEDSVKVMKINGLSVENNLTATEVINQSKNNVQQISIELFPNPNKTGTLQYSIDDLGNSFQSLNYEILCANGASIQKGIIKTSRGIIALPFLVNGMYYINFYEADFRQNMSFVIEHN